jgi:hypothetical protein
MESFKYVQFSFASPANYFAYNKLPMPLPSPKSKASTPDEERQADPVTTTDGEQPKDIEVFDSSNFDTFQDPSTPADNRGSNDENDAFMLAFKKAQPENRFSKAVSVTGPGLRDDFNKLFEMSDGQKDSNAEKFEEPEAPNNKKNLFDFDNDYIVDPKTILTNAHRFSDPPTPTLPFMRNSLKESPKKSQAHPPVHQTYDPPVPMANSKRVSFSQFDDYIKNGLMHPRVSLEKQSLQPEIIVEEEAPVRQIAKSRHSFGQAPALSLVQEPAQRPSLLNAKEENTQLKTQIAVLENEKTILNAQLHEVKQRLEKSENALEQYANQVLRSDDTELIEAKKTIVRLQGQIIKQNSQIAEIQKKVGPQSLPGSPISADNQSHAISYLQSVIAKLQSELSNVKNTNVNLQQRVEQLETQNTALRSKQPNVDVFNSLGPTGNKVTIDKIYLDVLVERVQELETQLENNHPSESDAHLAGQLEEALERIEGDQELILHLQNTLAETQRRLQITTQQHSDALQHFGKFQSQVGLLNNIAHVNIESSTHVHSDNGNNLKQIHDLKEKCFLLERENESLRRAHANLANELKVFEENNLRVQNQRTMDLQSMQATKSRIEDLEAQSQSNLKKAENFKNLLNNTLNLNEKLTKAKEQIESEKSELLSKVSRLEKDLALVSPQHAIIHSNPKFGQRTRI